MSIEKVVLESFEKSAFWIKFYAVLMYITAGVLFLFSLSSLFFGVAYFLFYLAISSLQIYLAFLLHKSANKMLEIKKENNFEEVVGKISESQISIKKYFMINTILTVSVFVMIILLFVVLLSLGEDFFPKA